MLRVVAPLDTSSATISPPPSLRVSRTYLQHAVLAYISSELHTFDTIIKLHSRGRLQIDASPWQTSLLSLPPELLLTIRSHLIPTKTCALLSSTTHSLASAFLSRARNLCANCLTYNVEVFGPDVLNWPSMLRVAHSATIAHGGDAAEHTGCMCGLWEMANGQIVEVPWRRREREREKARPLVIPDPTAPQEKPTQAPCDTTPGASRCAAKIQWSSTVPVNRAHTPQAWLDARLSRLTPNNAPIWSVINDVLATEFACEVVPMSPDTPFSLNFASGDEMEVFGANQDAIWIAPTSKVPSEQKFALERLARALALPTFPETSKGTATVLIATARDSAAAYLSARMSDQSIADERQRCSEDTELSALRRPAMSVSLGLGIACLVASFGLAFVA